MRQYPRFEIVYWAYLGCFVVSGCVPGDDDLAGHSGDVREIVNAGVGCLPGT